MHSAEGHDYKPLYKCVEREAQVSQVCLTRVREILHVYTAIRENSRGVQEIVMKI